MSSPATCCSSNAKPDDDKQDFDTAALRQNKGRFIGSVIGIRICTRSSGGGGEVKVYMDGDQEFPTICGTGSEDYVGLAWASSRRRSCTKASVWIRTDETSGHVFVSMYRCTCQTDRLGSGKRDTIQQISWNNGLAETQDDWSCATFWYEPVPSAPLPALPDVAARTANIWPGK